jgi:hypothetical protein
MGRMHSKGKGMASSAIPYKRTPPSWAKASPRDVEDHVCKLAKKGLGPSQVSKHRCIVCAMRRCLRGRMPSCARPCNDRGALGYTSTVAMTTKCGAAIKMLYW